MTKKIIIEINGGVVGAVYTDLDVEIILVDWDNIAAGGEKQERITAQPLEPIEAILQEQE